MRTFLVFVFVLGVASADLKAVSNRISRKDQVKAARHRLQGNWVMVRWQRGNSVVVYNPNEKLYVWSIRGDKLTAKQGALGWHMESTFTIDPTARPRALDAVDLRGPKKGKTGRYIYELDGNTLMIGYGGDGQIRPKDFVGKGAIPPVVIVFQKDKR